jgi:hypothetical protein
MQSVRKVGLEYGVVACALAAALLIAAFAARLGAHDDDWEALFAHHGSPRRLFEKETFGGNGRTCVTCHSRETGTLSPADAQARFARNPRDPLFLGDGSDDGQGNGTQRMLTQATVLVRVPLHPHVSLASDPSARSVVLRRGIPTTLNTPSLDPVLMFDGRQGSLETQAHSAIADHAQGTKRPTAKQLEQIAVFQRTPQFFSSFALFQFAWTGHAPGLPHGRTAAEKRGRRFFEDVPPDPSNLKIGSCAACHSGPMLNETNDFIPVAPLRRGGRFQSIAVSELNAAGNPVQDFVFKDTDGTTTTVSSPDPGRALITGQLGADNMNAFKIPSIWGVERTAPYFHDNSAKTLEDVMRHYRTFFSIVSQGAIDITEQDQADIIAFMKLLR